MNTEPETSEIVKQEDAPAQVVQVEEVPAQFEPMIETSQDNSQSIGTNFSNTFFNPFATGIAMTGKSTGWWFPFLLAVLVMTGSAILTKDQMSAMMEQKIKQRLEKVENLPPEKKAEIIEAATSKGSGFSTFSSVFAVPAMSALAALAIMFAGNLLMGGSARFGALFGAAMWAQLISSLSMLIRTPLILMNNSYEVTLGPGVLLPAGREGFFPAFLAGLDLMFIWHFVALGLMVAGVYNWKKSTGVVLVMTLYLIVLLGGASLA